MTLGRDLHVSVQSLSMNHDSRYKKFQIHPSIAIGDTTDKIGVTVNVNGTVHNMKQARRYHRWWQYTTSLNSWLSQSRSWILQVVIDFVNVPTTIKTGHWSSHCHPSPYRRHPEEKSRERYRVSRVRSGD
ncbi:uncharacterized protein N7503_004473 [Penicillium pulvis]|uniref:uncharacterized protein n=1 Tax=Penicillium pulvis TaxID=1562058 RepID=UPI002546FB51|nr:uncharacterized protein N7503_004473 [Penicillium pulvis]KAJ5802023.1 hypothetical protein N7503_004473 [Penicillium pulvis]